MTSSRTLVTCLAASSFPFLACGSGWKDEDTKSATDALRAQQTLLRYCETLPVGAPQCNVDTLRAVEQATVCNLGSMLQRHGTDILDGGAGCRPQ